MARERKNQANLSDAEWAAFVAAVKAIKAPGAASPTYAEIASAHLMARHQGTAHILPIFLPWHREFLHIFENRLRQEDDTVTIPYWDWTANRTMPTPLSNAGEWGVSRNLAPNDPLPLSLGAAVSLAMQQTAFGSFHMQIVPPHDTVHVVVGGEMGDIQVSPRDVLFWLHHCFLDKLWHNWQTDHPGSNPDVPAPLLPTDLFEHNGNEVMSIADLDYTYA